MNSFSKIFKLVIILFRGIFRFNNKINKARALPRPRSYPIIGNFLDLLKIPQNLSHLTKTYQPACRMQFLEKKLVFLNSLKAINTVFIEQGDVTNERPNYFFQKYVFENNGFGFGNYDARAAKQKLILQHFLQKQANIENPDGSFKDINNLLRALNSSSSVDVDVDVYLRPFLTDYFSKQVCGNYIC